MDFGCEYGQNEPCGFFPILFFKKALSYSKFAQEIAIIALATSGLKS